MSSIAHSFTVADVALRGAPVARPIFNEFDSFGALLSLPRLPEEKNSDYKKRLLDVYARRAGSNYMGLLNGITRELGLSWYKPITITLTGSVPTGTSPAFTFSNGVVRIYNDLPTEDIELELEVSKKANSYYLLSNFISEVNTNSSLYTVTANAGIDTGTRTDCIINQSSTKDVEFESLLESPQNKLEKTAIQPGSIEFSDKEVFREEVASDSLLTRRGHYYIDYANGIVKSFSTPRRGSTVRYRYRLDTWKPLATPVILRSLHSRDFQRVMFSQVAGINSTDPTENGIPTSLGAEIINELLSVVPIYWGV